MCSLVYVYVVCALVASCDRFTFGIVFFRHLFIQSVSNFENVCIVGEVCAVSFSHFSRKFSSVNFEFSIEKNVVVNQKRSSIEKSAQSLNDRIPFVSRMSQVLIKRNNNFYLLLETGRLLNSRLDNYK